MNIRLDKKTRLTSDKYSWMLSELHVNGKSGEEEWNVFGWYTTLDNACRGYYNRRLRLSEATSIAEAIQEAENVLRELVEALGDDFKVTRHDKAKGKKALLS